MRSTRRQFLAMGAAGGAALGAGRVRQRLEASRPLRHGRRRTGRPVRPGAAADRLAAARPRREPPRRLARPRTRRWSCPARRRSTAKILDADDKIVDRADRRAAPRRHPPGLLAVPLHDRHARLLPPERSTGRTRRAATSACSRPARWRCRTSGRRCPPFDTPTVDDHRGVEPYCSLTPDPCPLHDITLTQALQAGKPLVFMVGTPAHCQTGACAPALEFLVAARQRVGDRAVDGPRRRVRRQRRHRSWRRSSTTSAWTTSRSSTSPRPTA